jgi:protein-disulfide isomerase-like protein with CxxC motif
VQIRKLTAVLTTAAITSGAGIGVAQAQSTSGGQDGSAKPTRKARGHKPRRGMSDAQLSALAGKLGVTTSRLKAALAAIRPATPAGGERPKRGDMAADLAAALGVETAKVQEILDANHPAKPAQGPHGGPGRARPAKPDNTALIAALASGLGLDEATVKAAFDKLEAAHQAEHKARDAAFAAALAKELGLKTDVVQAALDATRPARAAKAS